MLACKKKIYAFVHFQSKYCFYFYKFNCTSQEIVQINIQIKYKLHHKTMKSECLAVKFIPYFSHKYLCAQYAAI